MPPSAHDTSLHHWIDRLRAPGIAILIAAICLAPLSAPYTLLIAFAVAVIARGPGLVASLMPADGKTAALAALALVGLGAASAAWSIRPLATLEQAAYEGLILLGLLAVLADTQRLDAQHQRRIAIAFIGTVLAAGLFFVIELTFNYRLTSIVLHAWPDYMIGNNPHKFAQNDGSLAIPNSHFNHHVIVPVLLVWPAIILAWTHLAPRRRTLLIAALWVAAVAAAFLSQSETAKLAVLVGTAAGVLTRAIGQAAIVLAGMTWAALVLLILPMSFLVHDAGLHEAAWLQKTGQQRIEMWNRFAGDATERPLLGAGMKSLRYEERKRVAAQVGGSSAREDIPQKRKHAHNMYVQMWYELGAAGALLLTGLGLALLWVVRTMAPIPRAVALGLFATVSSTGLTGHDLWQGWIHSTLAWAMVMFAMAGNRSHHAGVDPPPETRTESSMASPPD